MRSTYRSGGVAALCQVAVLLANAAIVFGVIGPEAAGDPAIVAGLVRTNPAPLLALELLKLAGAAAALLVVLGLRRLPGAGQRLSRAATSAGVTGVALLTLAGVAGLVAVVWGAGASETSGGATSYTAVSAAINAVGLGSLFATGCWTLLVSLAAWGTPALPRGLLLLGLALGAVSLLAPLLPPLTLLVLALSLAWSLWLGAVLLGGERPRVGELPAAR
jgi:hypothetical protein